MPRIKVEAVVDHLDREFRLALEDSVKVVIPDAEFDKRELFKEFKRAIYRRCSVWERVPGHCVNDD